MDFIGKQNNGKRRTQLATSVAFVDYVLVEHINAIPDLRQFLSCMMYTVLSSTGKPVPPTIPHWKRESLLVPTFPCWALYELSARDSPSCLVIRSTAVISQNFHKKVTLSLLNNCPPPCKGSDACNFITVLLWSFCFLLCLTYKLNFIRARYK